MTRRWTRSATVVAACAAACLLSGVASARDATAQAMQPDFLRGPVLEGEPLVVQASLTVHDVNDIDDVAETFEFTGSLRLVWKDPRQAFAPAEGAREKVYQGSYQFNELTTGWYPQLALVNASADQHTGGVTLRIEPDGTSTLTQIVTATAEVDLDLRWFPFDEQRLEAVFEVPGFGADEVRLEVAPGSLLPVTESVEVPQWTITGSELATTERGISSALVLTIDVARQSFYIRRLVTFPLAIIAFLSFSVFWMERSSLGDRINVSFIGILTAVAYQLAMGDVLPKISDFTVIHAFMLMSFVVMSATVVINLVVGALDKQGKFELGDRVDLRCRWIFPLVYVGLVGAIFVAASVLF